jgi:uncharacterized protein YceK
MLAILAVCGLSLTGCGTFGDAICGPISDQVYYRGVSMDLAATFEGMPWVAADIPLSFVADTVLLPSQSYQEWKHPRPHMDLWRTEEEQKAADKSRDESPKSMDVASGKPPRPDRPPGDAK